MKYVISEQQINDVVKKFKKEGVDRGELGHAMEELVINFMRGNLCDVVALKTNNYYMVLILTDGYYTKNYADKVTEHIKNYLGEYTNVIIQQSTGCEKMEES